MMVGSIGGGWLLLMLLCVGWSVNCVCKMVMLICVCCVLLIVFVL